MSVSSVLICLGLTSHNVVLKHLSNLHMERNTHTNQLFFSFHVVEELCVEGTIRLDGQEMYDAYIDSTGYVQVTSGLLEVCVNGTYLQICSNSLVDMALAEVVCYSLDFDGQSVEFGYIHALLCIFLFHN